MRLRFKKILGLNANGNNLEKSLSQKQIALQGIKYFQKNISDNKQTSIYDFFDFFEIKDKLAKNEHFYGVKNYSDEQQSLDTTNKVNKLLFFTLDNSDSDITLNDVGDLKELYKKNIVKNAIVLYIKNNLCVYGNIKNDFRVSTINSFFSQLLNQTICLQDIATKNCIEKINKFGIEKIELNVFRNKQKMVDECTSDFSKKIDLIRQCILSKEEEKNDDDLSICAKLTIYEEKNKNSKNANNKRLNLYGSNLSEEEDFDYIITLKNNNGEIKSSEFYYFENINFQKGANFDEKIKFSFNELEKFYNSNIKEVESVITY